MGRASSSKKVARAASTGGGRTARGSRPLGWYAAIAMVTVLGIAGIVFSRAEYRQEMAASADGSAPVPGKDHWHNAYGFYLCDQFTPNPELSGGFHSHSDGLVHIEPRTRREGGKNATVQRVLESADVELTEDRLQLPGGKEYEEGKTKCGGKAGVLQLRYNDDKPITTGLATRRLDEGGTLTIAFAPEGAEIPKPPSEGALREQLQGGGGQMPGSTPTPPSGEPGAPPGGEPGTAPDAPAEPTTPTVAPEGAETTPTTSAP